MVYKKTTYSVPLPSWTPSAKQTTRDERRRNTKEIKLRQLGRNATLRNGTSPIGLGTPEGIQHPNLNQYKVSLSPPSVPGFFGGAWIKDSSPTTIGQSASRKDLHLHKPSLFFYFYYGQKLSCDRNARSSFSMAMFFLGALLGLGPFILFMSIHRLQQCLGFADRLATSISHKAIPFR